MKNRIILFLLIIISVFMICSCEKTPEVTSETKDDKTVDFVNFEFKKIIASALNKTAGEITEKDLEIITGLDVYYYAERIGTGMEYQKICSVTVKKQGFNEVFEAYYNTPSELRDGMETPEAYYYNQQMDEFKGYEDIKLLTNLETLSLNSEYELIDDNPVKHFRNLKKLRELSLYNYAVPNLEDIGNFTELENLSVGINLRNIPDGVEIEYIDDLTPLKNLTKLKTLSLSGNAVSDLSPIVSLDSITELYVTNAALGDISPIAGMQNLKTVTLIYNGISDVTPLTKIAGLEYINLDYNYIQDLTPFKALNPDVVKYVSVDMNGFSDDSPLRHLGEEKVNLGYMPYWENE